MLSSYHVELEIRLVYCIMNVSYVYLYMEKGDDTDTHFVTYYIDDKNDQIHQSARIVYLVSEFSHFDNIYIYICIYIFFSTPHHKHR